MSDHETADFVDRRVSASVGLEAHAWTRCALMYGGGLAWVGGWEGGREEGWVGEGMGGCKSGGRGTHHLLFKPLHDPFLDSFNSSNIFS